MWPGVMDAQISLNTALPLESSRGPKLHLDGPACAPRHRSFLSQRAQLATTAQCANHLHVRKISSATRQPVRKRRKKLESTCSLPWLPSCCSASTSPRSRLPYFQHLLPVLWCYFLRFLLFPASCYFFLAWSRLSAQFLLH